MSFKIPTGIGVPIHCVTFKITRTPIPLISSKIEHISQEKDLTTIINGKMTYCFVLGKTLMLPPVRRPVLLCGPSGPICCGGNEHVRMRIFTSKS